MARMQLGVKRVTPEAIAKWKAERGYDKPLVYNGLQRAWPGSPIPFFSRNRSSLFVFDFGAADDGRDIAYEIRTRMGPSLALALPVFLRRPGGQHHLRADDGVFSRHLSRFLGRGAVRGHDVDLRPVLHHRRAVSGQQALASGADLRLPGRHRCGKVRDPAGGDRRDRRHRLQQRAGTAPSSWRKSARTMCARRAPRGCPR